MALHRKKKAELLDLASQLKIDISGKRDEIEQRVSNYLRENADMLAADARFAPLLPSRSPRRKSPPFKQDRLSLRYNNNF